MILLSQNQVQKIVLTLNELANQSFQKTRWRLTFLLEQARGDLSYSKSLILTDLNNGANRRYNEFEIDSSIFDIVGDYEYRAIQLDENDNDLAVVEVGKMRIFDENKTLEFPITSTTIIYK